MATNTPNTTSVDVTDANTKPASSPVPGASAVNPVAGAPKPAKPSGKPAGSAKPATAGKPAPKRKPATRKRSPKRTKPAIPVPGVSTFRELLAFVTTVDAESSARVNTRGRHGFWARMGNRRGGLDLLRLPSMHCEHASGFTLRALIADPKAARAWAKRVASNLPESDRSADADKRDVANRILRAGEASNNPHAEATALGTGFVLLVPANAPEHVLDAVPPARCYSDRFAVNATALADAYARGDTPPETS